MFTRAGLLLAWKEIRPYFIFSIMLFFAGMVIGGNPNAPTEFLNDQVSKIASISGSIQQSDTPEMTAFLLITVNNIVASLMAMGMGIIAGLMPIYTLIANGMMVGYLLAGFSASGENVFQLVVKGLLPHGILEMSAVFLACAFGIRFGMTLIGGVFGSAFGKKEPWSPFVRTATGAVPALIVIVSLLLLGAVVESTITYWLMKS
ncbi:stage II sporulation protein M [Cohnella cellulosilytica]|uniref:Stage II sporulation protein M n=1 Tax=Cohnella cellulosilytica TaxID=986710 RepID=A0ABW2FIH6_9BACL